MRTKIIVTMSVVFIITFFGYMGYRELIYEGSENAEKELAEQTISEESVSNSQYGQQRALIALREFRKGVAEETPGCNCGPEIDKYTQGVQSRWAPMFASWVAKEAGSPLYSKQTESWRFESSQIIGEYLQTNGIWYSRNQAVEEGFKPEVGDFIVFRKGTFEENMGHTDIVIKVNDDDTAHLVGGNIQDRLVYREDFPYLLHHGFVGFGRPIDPTASLQPIND